MTSKRTPLRVVIDGLAREDRANLAVLLEVDQDASVPDLCEAVRWLYHSKLRNEAVRGAEHIANGTLEIAGRTRLGNWLAGASRRVRNPRTNTGGNEDEAFPVPGWDELIEGLARHLKVHDSEADIATHEMYICQAIIVRALQEMKPEQRVVFFRGLQDNERVDWGDLVERGGPDGPSTAGARAGLVGLGLAQAAGFSLYTSSASALAFLTSSAGITLPFAAYSGLSSVLAVVTGPLGWLAAGGLLAWKLTSTNWKKLTPAVVYIINVRARKAQRARRQHRLP